MTIFFYIKGVDKWQLARLTVGKIRVGIESDTSPRIPLQGRKFRYLLLYVILERKPEKPKKGWWQNILKASTSTGICSVRPFPEPLRTILEKRTNWGRWEEPTLKDWSYTLRLVKEYFRKTRLVDIDQKAIQRFARNYVEEHSTTVTKDSTVSRRLQHLRQFFKSLQDKGLEVNPVPERALSKFFRRDEFTVKREKKTFSSDEIDRLEAQIYKELSNIRVNFMGSRLAILIALQTGMRPQEIQALRWDCLITEGKYHVFEIDDAWSEKYHHFNGHLKSRPRGDKRRTIPIDDRLYDTLLDFKKKQAIVLSNNDIVNKRNLILLNLKDYKLCAEGHPIGQQNMNVKLKDLCKETNIESNGAINMYTCRHSVASKLANTPGMSYPWAAARMGHTVDMFLKTYVHAMQDQTSDMLKLIGKQ